MLTTAKQQTRLVVLLATIPSRIGKLATVIDSLKQQTRKPDCIYVCISEFNEREGRHYEVPAWLRDDPTVRVCVAAKDYGPATKLLGMLREEPAPTTRIVIVDDDWLCNPDLVEQLELRLEPEHKTAIGLSGARLPRSWSEIEVRIGAQIKAAPPSPWSLTFLAEPDEDMGVDIIQFGLGVIVFRGWFADDIYALVEPHEPWFLADDVLFSAYLEHRGVKRLCAAGLHLPRLLEQATLEPLSGDGRMTKRYRAAIPAIAARLAIWQSGAAAAPSFAEVRHRESAGVAQRRSTCVRRRALRFRAGSRIRLRARQRHGRAHAALSPAQRARLSPQDASFHPHPEERRAIGPKCIGVATHCARACRCTRGMPILSRGAIVAISASCGTRGAAQPPAICTPR